MDATRDYYTKWSKSEREMESKLWNLNYDTSEHNYETENDS